MSFKYNDKLVIRDREQMEDLFKHRLQLFDETRTKTISFTNHTGIILHIKGNFDRSKNTLDLHIERAPNINLTEKDVNLIIGDNKANISLITRVSDFD